MMLGEKIDCETALRWGLAYRAYDDAELPAFDAFRGGYLLTEVHVPLTRAGGLVRTYKVGRPRQELFRRINRAPDGTAALVAMRAELLETTLRRNKRFHIDSIEISGEPTQYGIDETRRLLHEYGIRCWGAVTLTLGQRNLAAKDPAQRAQSVAYVKSVVAMVAALNGEIVTVVPATVGKVVPDGRPEEEWDWVVGALKEIYDEHAGVQDRFANTGIVQPSLAARLGLDLLQPAGDRLQRDDAAVVTLVRFAQPLSQVAYLALARDHHRERGDVHRQVHRQVEHRRLRADLRRDEHAAEHVARLGDRRPGQQPLQRRLADRADAADDDRHRGEHGQRTLFNVFIRGGGRRGALEKRAPEPERGEAVRGVPLLRPGAAAVPEGRGPSGPLRRSREAAQGAEGDAAGAASGLLLHGREVRQRRAADEGQEPRLRAVGPEGRGVLSWRSTPLRPTSPPRGARASRGGCSRRRGSGSSRFSASRRSSSRCRPETCCSGRSGTTAAGSPSVTCASSSARST